MAIEKMTDDEIQRQALAEIRSAEENRTTQIEKHAVTWDRYYGKKLGNEKKGRSQFITRDVMDTIEWMMPFFMKTFASGDPKIGIEIKGQEPFVGKALMDRIQTDLSNGSPSIFYLFYQWFKDALVSNTAFIKVGWDLDQKTVSTNFDSLSHENLAQIEEDPEVQVVEVEEQNNSFFDSTFNVKAEIKQTIKDTIFAENTPSWEFLVSSRAKDINDEHGKGQKTEVTLDYLKRINRANSEDEPFFKHLEEFEDVQDIQTDSFPADEDDEVDYTEKGMISFKEWYTRIDVDGDGYLEDIVCFLANNRLIRYEINKENFVPFSAIRPIIDCYKFYGIAWAELVIEIQNLKTMLFRRILDSFDFQVSGRWRVDPDGSVDLHSLYNHVPGGAIIAKAGSVEDISPQAFNPGNFAIIDYVESLKESRTGVTRYNTGMDANALNKTATGVVAIQSAAMQRMELVARIFAEGLRDFYSKIVLLYQQYSKGFSAKVYGQEQEITQEMLQGQVVCSVNMGVQSGVGAEESQRIERMLGLLFKVNEMYPGILTPEKIHNLTTRYISSMGFKQADDFISDLQSYMQEIEGTKKKKQAMQEQMIKLQQQMDQMELQIKGKDAETKAKKVEADAYLKEKEINIKGKDIETKAKKVEADAYLKEKEINMKDAVEKEKIAQDERESVRELEMDKTSIFAKGLADERNRTN